MTAALFGMLEQIFRLGVLGVEERHRYEDNILDLQKEFYEEIRKPSDEISHNRLDDIQLELRLLSTAVIEALRAKKT